MRIAFHRNLAGHHGGLPRFFQVLNGAFALAGVEVVERDDSPDLLYAPSLTFEEYPETDLPVVGTFHDAHWHHFPTFGRESSAVLEVLAQRWMARATLICCSSQAIRRELSTFYPAHAEKVRVVNLPPLLTETDDRGAGAGELIRRGLPPRFAYMPAQAGMHKNHMRLFVAWALLKARDRADVPPLVLSGMLTDEMCAPGGPLPLLGLVPGVDVLGLGYVPDDAVRVLFEQAELLVMPTLYDAGSFPIMEAMAAGVPVVSSNLPSVIEQVRRQGAWCTFFDRHRPEDIARAVEDALAEPARTAALARHARVAVASKGWDLTGAGYRAVFAEACARHRRWRPAETPELRVSILADESPGAHRWVEAARALARRTSARLGRRLALTVPVNGRVPAQQHLVFSLVPVAQPDCPVVGGPGDLEANATLGFGADCDLVCPHPFDPRGASQRDELWTRSRYALPDRFALALLGEVHGADIGPGDLDLTAADAGTPIVACGVGSELLSIRDGVIGLGLVDDRELRALYALCDEIIIRPSGRLGITAHECRLARKRTRLLDGSSPPEITPTIATPDVVDRLVALVNGPDRLGVAA